MSTAIGLDGHTIVVTGSGHGLGRAYAVHLASRGCNIVINDIDEAAGKETAAEIQRRGGKALFTPFDVSDYHSAGKIISSAMEKFGSVHAIIANAGILIDKSFLNMKIEEFNQVIQVHLMGTVNILHHAWPYLCQQKFGRVILTSSSSGLWGNFGQSNYDAAKFAIVGLMHALKLEGERYNIKINTIAPYAISRLGKGFFPEELEKEMSPEHISALAVYLCSKNCQLNGEIIELGAGRLTRAKLFRTEGVTYQNAPTPEDIMDLLPDFLNQPFKMTFDSAMASFEDHMKHQVTE